MLRIGGPGFNGSGLFINWTIGGTDDVLDWPYSNSDLDRCWSNFVNHHHVFRLAFYEVQWFAGNKKGNTAVTTRFVLKLFAQAYILSQSISKSSEMWEALLISLISFVLLLILEWIVEKIVIAVSGMKLEQGIHEGKVNYALFAGSLHVAGALIIGSI